MKKKSLIITTATFCMASFASLHGEKIIDTVRGMPVTNVNNDGVNASAGGSDLAGFTSRVSSAFDNNTGGTMVTGSFSSGTTDLITANFGQDLNRSLAVSVITPSGLFSTVSSSTFEPLNSRGFSYGGALSKFEFSLGPITDTTTDTQLSGWGVTEFGLTMLSREGDAKYPLDVRITATFSDATSSSLLSTIGGTRDESDTFYHFAASGGAFISGITIETFEVGTSTQVFTNVGFDNIGFVVAVPEPHTYALFAGLLGLACVGLRRRMGA